MQLRDEGAVALSDPLGKFLPGIAYADRTLESLLSHSSGMQSEPPGPWWERSPGVEFQELADAIDDSSAPFAPGETFHYTNLGYALLGEVVARLRDASWAECARTLVLEPLEMSRTTYSPEMPYAQGYSVHPYAETLVEEPHQDTAAMAPAGQLWSTVNDLVRYAEFLIAGDPRVLGLRTLEEMSFPRTTPPDEPAAAYGLGLRLVLTDDGTLVGHTGSMPGFQASLFVDRARRTGAAVLSNSTTGLQSDAIAPELLGIVAGTREPAELSTPPWRPIDDVPAEVLEILGVWHWGNTGFLFTWNGHEVVTSALRTGEERETFAWHDGAFVGTSGYHHGERLCAVRNRDGTINHLVAATFVYTRTPYDPRAPIPGGVPR